MKKIPLYLLITVLLVFTWQVTRAFLQEEDKQLRQDLRQTVEQRFADEAADFKHRYGLSVFHRTENALANVVLVHGLDEPGKVWRYLSKELAKHPVNVWILLYPNDQAITTSAAFFHDELVKLNAQGIQQITLIGHSMGGLVSRELLSNPELQCLADECEVGQRPLARQLIMVGTPNQGSELARLRAFAEFREQVTYLFEGRLKFLGWIFDGAGEAGIDLTPGSHFLTTLNARPLPATTVHRVIAGVVADEERKQLQTELADQVKLEPVLQSLNALLERIGDGMVALESAKLEGASLDIVAGNHTTIIRNLSADSDRVPTAVPLIMQYLGLVQ